MLSVSSTSFEERNVVQEFKKKHQSLLDNFQTLGWTMSEDPDLAEFAVSAFEQFEDELPVFEKAVAQAARIQKDPWIYQFSSWEHGMPAEDIRKQRTEVMACAMKKDVSEEYLGDCQKRWENAEFSEMSDQYIVIGDLYCKRLRPGAQKLELDEESEFSSKGRKDVTYQLWEGGKLVEKITAVRPKLNGERFVLVNREGKRILKGFKEFEILYDRTGFVPKLVEYYAGEYYCIEPPVSTKVDIRVCYPGSKKELLLTLKGHPWMSIAEYLSQEPYLNSHKYDGIMFQVGSEELRAKWVPTGEVEINGMVWEVSALPTPYFHRPRQGKKSVPMSALVSQLRARLRGHFIVDYLRGNMCPAPVVQPLLQQADILKTGSKALVLTVDPAGRKLKAVFIRESLKDQKGMKPLDMLGGIIELGESPIEAMIREMREETQWVTTPEMYVEMGTSEGKDEKARWKSYLFLIYMPWTEYVKVKDLESYDLGEEHPGIFATVKEGAPKQEWFARNWLSATDRLKVKDLKDYYVYYMMMVAKDSSYAIALSECGRPSDAVRKVAMEVYTAKMIAYGEKIRAVDPTIGVEAIISLLQKSWYFDRDLQQTFADRLGVVRKQELVECVFSEDISALRKVLEALFRENEKKNRQTSLNPFQLRSILRSWGFEGSDKQIKKMMQKAISLDIVTTQLQSNNWGGMVYRLK